MTTVATPKRLEPILRRTEECVSTPGYSIQLADLSIKEGENSSTPPPSSGPSCLVSASQDQVALKLFPGTRWISPHCLASFGLVSHGLYALCEIFGKHKLSAHPVPTGFVEVTGQRSELSDVFLLVGRRLHSRFFPSVADFSFPF